MRYRLIAFVISLAAPVLAIASAFTMAKLLNLVGWQSAGTTPFWVAAILGVVIPGWILSAKTRLPDTLRDRYLPLVLPPLLCALALSFYLRFIKPTIGMGWLLILEAMGSWVLFFLGIFLGVFRRKCSRQRRKGILYLTACTSLFCGLIGANLYPIVSNTFYGQRDNVGREVDVWAYFPFNEGNHLARPDITPSLQIGANHPRLEGSAAILQIYGAIAQAVYDIDSGEYYDYDPQNDEYLRPASRGNHIRDVVDFSSTAHAFERLVKGEIDIFFGVLPCEKQLQAAVSHGLTPVLTPIAREALVFFVHRDNPVTDLSLAQLQHIYTGKITNWKATGGPNSKILAFQRPEGTDSQDIMTTMIMHGQPMAAPLREEYGNADCFISNVVADYRNRTNSLGYSLRWLASQQFSPEDIRFLSIDGVAPTPENIQTGKYPLTVPVVMITCHPLTAEAKALRDWITGPEGQALIAKIGYTPVNKDVRPIKKREKGS